MKVVHYLKLLILITLLSCGGGSEDDSQAGSTQPPADNGTTPDQGTQEPTSNGYQQTGALALGSVSGGLGADTIPVGLTNTAVGDVGVGSDNGDGTVGLSLPSLAGTLNLSGTNLVSTTAVPASIYNTTIPNQCGTNANDVMAVACNRMQYVVGSNGETTQPSIFEDLLFLDNRLQGFVSSLDDGRKPICLLTPADELVDHRTKFTESSLTTTMPALYLSCADFLSAPNGLDYMVGFGKKDDTWYMLEHVETQRMHGVTQNTTTGDFTVFNGSWNSSDSEGGKSHYKIHGTTNYIELSEDEAAAFPCPKQAIWGKVGDGYYMYLRHWNQKNGPSSNDDVCQDTSGNPEYEGCVNLAALATELTIASTTACTTLKNALSLPKENRASDTSAYEQYATQNSTGKLNYLTNWFFNDAIIAMKQKMFRAPKSDGTTVNEVVRWLDNIRGTLELTTSNSRAPCFRSDPVSLNLNTVLDFTFPYHMNCIEQENSYATYQMVGQKDNAWYAIKKPSTEEAGYGQRFVAKMAHDTTNLWYFSIEKSSQDNSKTYDVAQIVSNTTKKEIEMVFAGIGSQLDMGCGVQMKFNESFIYARGRFASYKSWDDLVDSTCSNVPLQELCVKADDITRTAMSNCTDASLDFLTLAPIVPTGFPKPTENTIEFAASKIDTFYATDPSGITEFGEPGSWGKYDGANVTPDINDPQYNIGLQKTVEGALTHTDAWAVCSDPVEAERTRTSEINTTFLLDLGALDAATKDGLSVAAPAKVFRLVMNTTLHDNAFFAPASNSHTGTATLTLDDNGTETVLGTQTITIDTHTYEFGELLSDRTSFEGLKLKLDLSMTSATACAEATIPEPETMDPNWGRSRISYEAGNVRVLF